MIDYNDNLEKGRPAELIYKNYLDENNIKYIWFNDDLRAQKNAIDFKIENRWYCDVKSGCYDGIICYETWEDFGNLVSPMIMYKMYEMRYVFVSVNSNEMFELIYNNEFISWLSKNIGNYKEILNEPYFKDGIIRQSAFIRIPIKDIPNNLIKIIK